VSSEPAPGATSPALASASPVIVWLRRALRVADNPVLAEAVATGSPVLPVWIWAPAEDGAWAPGGASRWWLRRSLETLDSRMSELSLGDGGGEPKGLVVRSAEGLSTASVLAALMRETGSRLVIADTLYEPAAVARDAAVATAVREAGGLLRSVDVGLLCPPGSATGSSGGPVRVFTPFWKRCAGLPVAEPLPEPAGLRVAGGVSRALSPADVLGTVDVGPAHGCSWWRPGEAGALQLLDAFAAEGARGYADTRDRTDLDGTSRLSAALHFGELSPRQVLAALADLADARDEGTGAFVRQVYWREFAYHLLAHFPETQDRPLRPEFERFPWRDDPRDFAAWREGRTGYPFVDAGMRQLLATGWMHNRARLVVASFLTKDLLLPWQDGSAWFWERLVDADLADNTLGWQWTAGSGADAAPYFRVFNPVIQCERFDPTGRYVRRWVPEIARLPDRWLHKPWEADAKTLAEAGVALGRDYPAPIVDHREARQRALAAFGSVRTAL
jgi:deoxyribodipyrimidine photo-lyase